MPVGARPGAPTSPFNGVSYEEFTGRWKAIRVRDGVRHNLGRHDDQLAAAWALEEWRQEHEPDAPPDPLLVTE